MKGKSKSHRHLASPGSLPQLVRLRITVDYSFGNELAKLGQ